MRTSFLLVFVLAACAPLEPDQQRVQTPTYTTGSYIPKRSPDAVVVDKEVLNQAQLRTTVPGKLER